MNSQLLPVPAISFFFVEQYDEGLRGAAPGNSPDVRATNQMQEA